MIRDGAWSAGEDRASRPRPWQRAAGGARSLLRSAPAQRAKMLALRAFAPALEPRYGGVASIPVFHRVVAPRAGERVGFAHRAESSVAQIEAAIGLLRSRGCAFVSLDELCAALGKPRSRRAPHLVALTFDDGYRDNHDVVYPLLSSLSIPFAIYVATGFADRAHAPWWILVEEDLLGSSRFAIESGGRELSWRLDGPAARKAAFLGAEAVFTSLGPADARALAARMFGAERVERSIDSLFLSWDMIRAMAAGGRVTIGAHAVDHVPLADLPLAEARAQIGGSKARIEAEIGRAVRHFSYPFGALGARERDLVRDAGFTSATTICCANVVPEHREHLLTLPRIHAELPETRETGDLVRYRAWLSLQLTGALPAITNRGRRLVTLDD